MKIALSSTDYRAKILMISVFRSRPSSTCMCIGKGVLTRRVSEAFFIVMDPGGYEGEKRT